MQQHKHGRIFRPGLSVKDGEPVYLDGAIKSWVFLEAFLSLGLGLKRNEASIRQIRISLSQFAEASHCQDEAEFWVAAPRARVTLRCLSDHLLQSFHPGLLKSFVSAWRVPFGPAVPRS